MNIANSNFKIAKYSRNHRTQPRISTGHLKIIFNTVISQNPGKQMQKFTDKN